ncbi:hypothetical protein [Terribacillus sp. JSM ZJ617]|uniref:hypothetical protein n=1 Tax=Terribacillus sp. JSM ZJ617 TaxID=3342119 RepID=UPI0035A92C74
MDYNIFYSWQSDLPNASNRGFIESCIKSAIKELSIAEDFHLELNLDRDTKDELGTPDIVSTIFDKIENSKIFIADISIINSNSDGRKTPNPNVLLELGYAAKVLGWEKVICLFNTDYGDFKDLPFDLKFRRPLTYGIEGQDKSKVKARIKKVIKETISSLHNKGMLYDDLNDYLKMQVDTQILTVIKNLDYIIYGYDGESSFDKYSRLLSMEYSDIKDVLGKRRFLGFQVFKNFEKIEKELTTILMNITASAYFKKEIGVSIVNLIRWINRFDKFNSLRQSPDLFVTSGEKTDKYRVLFGPDINPQNEEIYLLIKVIDDSHGQVTDSGQFQEKQKVDQMLDYVSMNKNYIEIYAGLLYEFIQLINKWLSLTNGEFIMDNLKHFEFRYRKL